MNEPGAAIVAQYAALNGRLRDVVRGLDVAALDRSPAEGENTIAVLVMHTIGSERGWLSLAAGRTHQRDREAEFGTRGRAPDDLVAAIDAADVAMRDLVDAAVGAGLETIRTTGDGRSWTVARCVAHSLAHTAEHVGHAELTRNLVSPRPAA